MTQIGWWLFTSELMRAAQRLYQSLSFQSESELPKRLGVRYFRHVLSLDGVES